MKKRTLLKTMLLALVMMPMGAWAQSGVVKSWDFTQTMPTDDKTHLDAELGKTEGTKLWVQDGENANTYMNNTAYGEFTELTADGTNTIAFTQGLLFKIGSKNNVRIYQQDSKKYIQMKDGVQIEVPSLKKGWSVKISAQLSNAEYTLSFDSDQLTQVSKDQDNKNVTIVSKVTTTGDVVFTINSKNTADTGQNIYVYSIAILPYTETPVKSWDFTSFADDDITNLNADAPAGAGEPVTYGEGTYWQRISNDNRYQNYVSVSDAELVAKNEESTIKLSTTDGIYFTASTKGGIKIYNESKSKFMYIDARNVPSKDISFKINLHKGEKVVIDAKSTSGSNAAKISTTAVSGISSTNTSVTGRTDFVFYVSEDGDYTFYADGYSMYLYGITITKQEKDAATNANGYGTFSAPFDVQIFGVKVYKAQLNTSTKTITCTEIADGKVPAGAGVLLYGDADASIALGYASGVAALTDNNLIGTTKSDGSLMAKDAGKYQYVLSGNTFKHFTGAAFTPGKAYFETPSEVTAPNFSIEFSDGNTTGISEALNVKSQDDATTPVYNLAGQRVANPTKGLYIVNGKKVVIK